MVKERKGSQKEHCQECLSRSQPEHPLEAENEKNRLYMKQIHVLFLYGKRKDQGYEEIKKWQSWWN